MPENTENQVDYTGYLNQISADVYSLRKMALQKSELPPAYESQLQEVVALLTEMKESGQNDSSLDSGQIETLVVSVQNMEKSVKSILNVNQVILCGIGLVIGVLCALIFSHFVKG